MERLNNILGRAPLRRPSDQLNNNTSAPQPRVSQVPPSSQGPARRPQAEQGARQIQRQPYAAQPHPSASRPAIPRATRDLGRGEQNNRAGYVSEGHATAAYPDPVHYDEGGPRVVSARRPYAQPERGATSSQAYETSQMRGPSPSRSQVEQQAGNGPYYAVEAYDGRPRADVLHRQVDSQLYEYEYDGYDEYDEEEDGAGIYYGDWESGERMVSVPSTPRRREYQDYTMLEPARIQEPVPPPYLTNNVRATRDLRALPPAAAVPAPQEPPQLAQRMTQPLRPQTITDLGRERERSRAGTQGIRSVATIAPATEQMSPASQPVQPRKAACPRCRGAGYVRENVPFGHPHFGKAIACECKEAERKEKRRQQLREISNLDAFRQQRFQTFNTRIAGVLEAYQAARDFANEPEGWLWLQGPNGCGKTHLAIAIAQQVLESGAVVLFEPVPDLLDHLRAAFAPNSNEVYDQLFAKMREAEVLILDDLGAQQSSPWANEKLFQLLNYRYNMNMPTVITSNHRIGSNIDERIRSRLGDIGLVKSIVMSGAQDYRPRHAKRS